MADKQPLDRRKLVGLLAPVLPMLAGLVFIGAGFNATGQSNDTVFRALGIALLAAGLAGLYFGARPWWSDENPRTLLEATALTAVVWAGGAFLMAWSEAGGNEENSGIYGGLAILVAGIGLQRFVIMAGAGEAAETSNESS